MPASYPPLPLVSDDELRTAFGDSDRVRQYRMLQAVLVRGLTHREAAEHAGVSERTIRNVLQRYRREGGFERMRERNAAPRRASPERLHRYEPALASALAEEPEAGGDRLWQRARELLGDAGGTLSRRTAYRILADLRADHEREVEHSDEVGTVRSALALLIEDPPLTLGAMPLAQKLLPTESDTLLRGTLLRQALRSAIDALRPGGEIAAIDRDWWPYLICSGEYEAGQSRSELEQALALSPSTYSRAKRQGLAQIAAALQQKLAALTESRQSRVSQLLPRTPDFVGRREEQSYYAWRLQTEGMAFLWGLPGSGKTALAAELAAEGRRYGQSIVWHTCDAHNNTRLSGVAHGLLHGLPASPGEPTDLDDGALLDTLRARLQLRPTVVIIDDIHRADECELAPLLELLHQLSGRGAIRLLLVGQRPPKDASWAALPGLAEADARVLWADLRPLPDAQWHGLYAATAGFPQPLRSAAAAYRRAGERVRADDWRSHALQWANERLWQPLAENERALLAVAHGLADHAWAGESQQVLDTLGIDDAQLGALYRRSLLTVGDRRLIVHPALALVAAAALAADATLLELYDQISRCTASADESPLAISCCTTSADEPPLALQQLDQDMVQSRYTAAPTGRALLDRVRAALERSAAYLADDAGQDARHLLDELATLNAALSGPAWARQ